MWLSYPLEKYADVAAPLQNAEQQGPHHARGSPRADQAGKAIFISWTRVSDATYGLYCFSCTNGRYTSIRYRFGLPHILAILQSSRCRSHL